MIIDANVLVSALLGRSMPLLLGMIEQGHNLLMPEHQYREAKLVVSRERDWPEGEFEDAADAVVSVLSSRSYSSMENIARERLGPRGQPDWPVLAAAMAYTDDVWSNDRDFFGVGVAVWSTANIGFAVGAK